MPQILRKNDKFYSFRTYNGRDPKSEDLRVEQEKIYKYLEAKYTDLINQLETKLEEVNSRLDALEP